MRSLVRFTLALTAALFLILSLITGQPAQAQKAARPQAKTATAPQPLAPAASTNYTVTQATGAIVSGTTAVPSITYNCGAGSVGDDCTAPITLPFAFTFYDQSFLTANVSSNGNLQFLSANPDFGTAEVCLPLAQFNYVILPHWGDLTIGGANEGIFTSVTGTTPNRIFNIEWRASFIGNAPGSLNFEIRLYEGQERFDIVFGSVPGSGIDATVGAQRGTGSTYTEYNCHGSNAVRNGQLLSFIGSGAASLFIAGRVTNSDGVPISGVTVDLTGATTAQTVTDATGDYAFTGLTAGSSYTVTPTQPGANFYRASRQFGPTPLRPFTGNFVVNFIRTVTPNPGDVLISEFRFRGVGGGFDEFIELYNNTNAAITVNATDGSSGWLLQTADGSVNFFVPNGTTIPARGHYLAGNGSGYSLFGYGSADIFYNGDVSDNVGVALFNTANTSNINAATRLDAVGFSGETNTLYREGAGLPTPGATNGQYSFVRRLTSGTAQDTNDNAADFVFVAPDAATYGGVQARLGAPGPENLASPVQRNASLKAGLFDPTQANSATPNRVRSQTPVTNGPNGTLVIRRKFTNATGVPITRLRFRIVDITTAPAPAGAADLRALTSADALIALPGGGSMQVRGLTLEIPPTQTAGGGLNSSLVSPFITVAQPLASNGTISVEFRLGVVTNGVYRFFINVETLP